MQVEAFEIFRSVVRHGSVSAAARVLGYTQSAVSRQIAALEQDLGSRLLQRSARGMTLTDAGRCLLPHAEAVLDRVVTAHRELEALRGLGGGRVRVGAFPTAMAALVPRAIARFREAYPAVEVSVIEGLTPALVARLRTGEADVAVLSSPPEDLVLQPLLDEELLVAVPAGHRLARRRTIRLSELEGDVFIAGSATAEETLLRATLPAGFRPRIDIVVAEWTGKLGCVAAGLGVALVPALALRARPSDVVLLRIHKDDAAVRHIFAATVGEGSPAVYALIRELRTEATQMVKDRAGPPRKPTSARSKRRDR